MSRRSAGVVALIGGLLLAPRPARADGGVGRMVHEIRSAVQHLAGAPIAPAQHPRGRSPAPQPIAAGGPTIDLSDLSHPVALEASLRGPAALTGPSLKLTIPDGQARLGDFSIGSDQALQGHLLVIRGNADVYGRLLGNLVTLDGDVTVHPGGTVSGDVLALRGEVHDAGGEIGGEVRTLSAATPVPATEARPALSAGRQVFQNLAGVVGVLLTVTALGFGLVTFGRHNLEIVSDTVIHSFGRAFVSGLLGQMLLLPTFGMLVVGLILSVAGVLLLPFAVVVYVLLVVGGIVGGFLAVAHAMGETYVRRRLALGAMGSPNSYRYVLLGMTTPAVLWLAWAVFGWVPVAGDLIRGAALLVTWLLATAGFGAALLSRAGIRHNFAGRLIPPEALTDEYLWATPQFGVPAAQRPGGTRTPPSRR